MAKHYYRTESGRIHETERLANTFTNGWEKLPAAQGAREYKEQARADLREYVKPGARVYTVLRHVSASGMSREISLFVADVEKRDGKRDGKRVPIIRDITHTAAAAMADNIGKRGGIVIGGAGMDMGFSLVYNLGRSLWPNGTKKPHGTRNGKPDSDGGYALNHSWL